MIVTLAYLRRQFDEFNRLVFNGSLPTPRLRVSNSRTMLGCVHYKKQRGWFGRVGFSDFTLSISAFYDLSEEMLDDTILHEMIHLDILSHHQVDDSAHGPLFRQKMEEINRHFGRHITVTHRGQLQQAQQSRPVQNVIAVSLLADGTWGITRPSQSRILDISRSLPRYYRIKEIRWYNSRNPYFSTIPRCLKPKIYRADPAVLQRELEGAVEISLT